MKSRPQIFAALVIAFWFALAAVASRFAAKLGSLQKNNLADFLPASAEAMQALKAEQRCS